ncbi:MAG: phosphoribosyl-AMP cyclohydrolase [Candidatus Hydrogenedentes bacterium]|nr:phosphoribosyl-AMP cyclohydrolase [Candidatus Hydrogenedentota bacterium]
MCADAVKSKSIFDVLKLDANGLVAAVVQDVNTKQVLMVGYMNRESLEITLSERRACFWSRSRQKLWRKGESSGNVLNLVEIRTDCDNDAMLLVCDPVGPTCHTNETSCFYRVVKEDGALVLSGDGVATE